MAQYLMGAAGSRLKRVIDFVDVDSDKWRQYSGTTGRFSGWIYAREARRLLDEGEVEELLASGRTVMLTDRYAPVDQMLAAGRSRRSPTTARAEIRAEK